MQPVTAGAELVVRKVNEWRSLTAMTIPTSTVTTVRLPASDYYSLFFTAVQPAVALVLPATACTITTTTIEQTATAAAALPRLEISHILSSSILPFQHLSAQQL